MAVETVLLALLGVVAAWLAFDAGRERHRLRARMERATSAAARSARTVDGPRTPDVAGRLAVAAGAPLDTGSRRSASPSTAASLPGEGWRYWPLTVSATEDGSVGPRF